MAHTLTNLLAHVIFSTRGRAPLIVDAIRGDLHAYLGGILGELHATPIIIGGTMDHVHLLIQLPANLAVADCLRVLKTNSSPWVKERWPERRSFGWQSGYGVFSVSESNRASVIRYIQQQAQHHFKVSFQDELLALLRKHDVAFDEQYLWR
jgi:REP element-mobilizing transposase RayT